MAGIESTTPDEQVVAQIEKDISEAMGLFIDVLGAANGIVEADQARAVQTQLDKAPAALTDVVSLRQKRDQVVDNGSPQWQKANDKYVLSLYAHEIKAGLDYSQHKPDTDTALMSIRTKIDAHQPLTEAETALVTENVPWVILERHGIKPYAVIGQKPDGQPQTLQDIRPALPVDHLHSKQSINEKFVDSQRRLVTSFGQIPERPAAQPAAAEASPTTPPVESPATPTPAAAEAAPTTPPSSEIPPDTQLTIGDPAHPDQNGTTLHLRQPIPELPGVTEIHLSTQNHLDNPNILPNTATVTLKGNVRSNQGGPVRFGNIDSFTVTGPNGERITIRANQVGLRPTTSEAAPATPAPTTPETPTPSAAAEAAPTTPPASPAAAASEQQPSQTNKKVISFIGFKGIIDRARDIAFQRLKDNSPLERQGNFFQNLWDKFIKGKETLLSRTISRSWFKNTFLLRQKELAEHQIEAAGVLCANESIQTATRQATERYWQLPEAERRQLRDKAAAEGNAIDRTAGRFLNRIGIRSVDLNQAAIGNLSVDILKQMRQNGQIVEVNIQDQINQSFVERFTQDAQTIMADFIHTQAGEDLRILDESDPQNKALADKIRHHLALYATDANLTREQLQQNLIQAFTETFPGDPSNNDSLAQKLAQSEFMAGTLLEVAEQYRAHASHYQGMAAIEADLADVEFRIGFAVPGERTGNEPLVSEKVRATLEQLHIRPATAAVAATLATYAVDMLANTPVLGILRGNANKAVLAAGLIAAAPLIGATTPFPLLVGAATLAVTTYIKKRHDTTHAVQLDLRRREGHHNEALAASANPLAKFQESGIGRILLGQSERKFLNEVGEQVPRRSATELIAGMSAFVVDSHAETIQLRDLSESELKDAIHAFTTAKSYVEISDRQKGRQDGVGIITYSRPEQVDMERTQLDLAIAKFRQALLDKGGTTQLDGMSVADYITTLSHIKTSQIEGTTAAAQLSDADKAFLDSHQTEFATTAPTLEASKHRVKVMINKRSAEAGVRSAVISAGAGWVALGVGSQSDDIQHLRQTLFASQNHINSSQVHAAIPPSDTFTQLGPDHSSGLRLPVGSSAVLVDGHYDLRLPDGTTVEHFADSQGHLDYSALNGRLTYYTDKMSEQTGTHYNPDANAFDFTWANQHRATTLTVTQAYSDGALNPAAKEAFKAAGLSVTEHTDRVVASTLGENFKIPTGTHLESIAGETGAYNLVSDTDHHTLLENLQIRPEGSVVYNPALQAQLAEHHLQIMTDTLPGGGSGGFMEVKAPDLGPEGWWGYFNATARETMGRNLTNPEDNLVKNTLRIFERLRGIGTRIEGDNPYHHAVQFTTTFDGGRTAISHAQSPEMVFAGIPDAFGKPESIKKLAGLMSTALEHQKQGTPLTDVEQIAIRLGSIDGERSIAAASQDDLNKLLQVMDWQSGPSATITISPFDITAEPLTVTDIAVSALPSGTPTNLIFPLIIPLPSFDIPTEIPNTPPTRLEPTPLPPPGPRQNPGAPIYGLDGPYNPNSGFDLGQYYEERRHPVFKSNPRANISFTEATDWYFGRQSGEYNRALESLNAQLPPMSEDCDLAICIPVAAHQEGKNIRHTLEQYLGQKDDAGNRVNHKYEIILFLNKPTDAQADETIQEIEKFMQEHPEMPIRPVYGNFDRGSVVYGSFIKYPYDLAMLRARKRQNSGREIIIATGDADLVAVSNNYVSDSISYFNAHPDKDAFLAKQDMDNEVLAAFPSFFATVRFAQLLDAQSIMNRNRRHIQTQGRTTLVRGSTLAAIGGVNYNTGAGADTEIGKMILAARTGSTGSAPADQTPLDYVNRVQIRTNPRRELNTVLSGLGFTDTWNSFNQNMLDDTVRSKSMDELVRDYGNRGDIDLQEFEKQINSFRHWNVHMDSSAVRKALGFMGLKYGQDYTVEGNGENSTLRIIGPCTQLQEDFKRFRDRTRQPTP